MKKNLVSSLLVITAALMIFNFQVLGANEMKMERFAPPSEKPNNVTTEVSKSAPQYIEPIPFSQDPEKTKALLKEKVEKLPRVTLITDDGDYLHFEFRSFLFRFVDDVEFRVDSNSKTIRMRSASRVGYGDMGVNRKRLEEIRTILKEAGI